MRVIDMKINEVRTEVRKIEKYYDFNHQTNDYDVLVNLTEIANLILLKNKISYNKALDDFVKALQEKIEKDLVNPDLALECKKCGIWKNYDIKEIAEQLKASGK